MNSVMRPDCFLLQGHLGLLGWLKVVAEYDADLQDQSRAYVVKVLCCANSLMAMWSRDPQHFNDIE